MIKKAQRPYKIGEKNDLRLKVKRSEKALKV